MIDVGTTKLFYCTIVSGLKFFADSLQLGYNFEVLGTAGGAFHLNEFVDVKTAVPMSVNEEFDGVRQKVLIRSAAASFRGDLPKQINATELSGQRKVQTARNCLRIPTKRQAQRSPSRVRLQTGDRRD